MISGPEFPREKPRRRVGGWGLLALLLLAVPVAAQPSKEYDLKAVFLYNFATFVEWPAAAQPAPGEPFIIGVLGDDPFGHALADVVAGEKVRGAPIKIVHGRRWEDIRECHILFISNSENLRWGLTLTKLRDRPVLTVGDSPRFVNSGGMIAFSTDSRVQLTINPARATEAGLTISSKLLRVAKARGNGPP